MWENRISLYHHGRERTRPLQENKTALAVVQWGWHFTDDILILELCYNCVTIFNLIFCREYLLSKININLTVNKIKINLPFSLSTRI